MEEKCKFVREMVSQYKTFILTANNDAINIVQDTIRKIILMIEQIKESTELDEIFLAKDRLFSIDDITEDLHAIDDVQECFNSYITDVCKEEKINNMSLIKVAVINETIKELITLIKLFIMTKSDVTVQELLEIKNNVFMITYEKFFKGFFPLVIALSN